jgi:hypothetical protein
VYTDLVEVTAPRLEVASVPFSAAAVCSVANAGCQYDAMSDSCYRQLRVVELPISGTLARKRLNASAVYQPARGKRVDQGAWYIAGLVVQIVERTIDDTKIRYWLDR